jgi:uncharacterized protein YqgC (DUF456 family)
MQQVDIDNVKRLRTLGHGNVVHVANSVIAGASAGALVGSAVPVPIFGSIIGSFIGAAIAGIVKSGEKE